VLERNTTLRELSSSLMGDDGTKRMSSSKGVVPVVNWVVCWTFANVYQQTFANIYLLQALERNKTLRELHLSSNQMGDEGIKCVADAMRCNNSLTVLDITRNVASFKSDVRGILDNSSLRDFKSVRVHFFENNTYVHVHVSIYVYL